MNWLASFRVGLPMLDTAACSGDVWPPQSSMPLGAMRVRIDSSQGYRPAHVARTCTGSSSFGAVGAVGEARLHSWLMNMVPVPEYISSTVTG